MSVPVRNRWTPSHRCPICDGCDRDPRGQGKRCTGYESDDGKWARCSREEYSGALRPDDYSLFAHCLDGVCPCGQTHAASRVVSKPQRAAATRNGKIEATYDYHDETGDLLFQVVRFEGKQFAQRRPDDTGPGEWAWNLQGVRRVLYRLPDLLAAPPTKLVIVTEGEKDADALRKRGYVATCNPHGAGKWKGVVEHAAGVLRGRDVVVWADADEPGRKHARQVAEALRSHVKTLRVIESWRGKDAADHLAAGGTVEELLEMTPAPKEAPAPPRAIRLAAAPDDLPEVLIGTDLERMTDAACNVLAADVRVFQRGGMLCEVVSVPSGPKSAAIERDPDAQVIRNLTAPTVRERLASGARWLKFDGRDRSRKPAIPPDHVVSGTMARGQWPNVRPIVAVATSPCLRPDGSVLQTAGYDEQTGILYRPTANYAEVAERPTLEDARGALGALREVVCDFPFARPEHESAWIAGVLTMLARGAIDGPVPLFAVDATTRGTGKSRLVDAACLLVHGTVAARSPLPDDDDEMRKRITSLLLDGDPAILFDNVTQTIALPSLDAMLTSETWKDRRLGLLETVFVPVRCVSWTTGNNISLGGDLSRRTIHIRLESQLENPEERTNWRHPLLLDWIKSQRHRLVACALTVLRAFFVAGGPGARHASAPWGSFEAWSRLVPPVLSWCGLPDPMLARATASDALDEERMHLAALIDGLHRLCELPMTARHILEVLYPERDPREATPPDGYDDMRDAIESETYAKPGNRPDARKLGKWLQKSRGRVLGGWMVERVDGAGHVAAWRARQR